MPDTATDMMLPPDDIVAAWEQRRPLRTTVSWREMWRAEHARAFTVAKVAKLDLLARIQSSLDEVIRRGGTFEEWKRDLLPELQRAGWWGTVADRSITGTDEPVEINDHRLRTIFNTNMKVSASAGAWRRVQAEKDAFPYIRYLSNHPRKHPRKDHASWHGLILPVDHPLWEKIWPPNGWGCGCWYQQVNDIMLELNGWKVSDPADFGIDDEAIRANIKPEWLYSAGSSNLQSLIETVGERAQQNLDLDLVGAAQEVLEQLIESPAANQFIDVPNGRLPLFVMPEGQAIRVGSKPRIAWLSMETQIKQIRKAGQKQPERRHVATYRAIAKAPRNYLVLAQEGSNVLKYIVPLEDRLLFVVVKVTGARDEFYVTSARVQSDTTIAAFLKGCEVIDDRRDGSAR